MMCLIVNPFVHEPAPQGAEGGGEEGMEEEDEGDDNSASDRSEESDFDYI